MSMKTPIHAVLFDLGNTLIYDKEPWENLYLRADKALWKSLHSYGVKFSPRDLYGRHKTLFHLYYKMRENDLDEPGIGPALQGLLGANGIHLSGEDLQAALRSMYRITQANWFAEEDAIPMLDILKTRGFRLGIISNGADDQNTYTLIDKVKIRPYFEYIISSAAYGKRKPYAGIFQAALDHFGIPPGQVVMVGDTFEADIVGAHQVGMNSIWVTRRVQKTVPHSGIKPDGVASTLSEIPALLPA